MSDYATIDFEGMAFRGGTRNYPRIQNQVSDFSSTPLNRLGGGANYIQPDTASTSLGRGAMASGSLSVAIGPLAYARENNSVVTGADTTGLAANVTVVGAQSSASGINSTVVGEGAAATGINSTLVGQSLKATKANVTAVGQSVTVTGSKTTAVGQGATASGDNGTAIGQGTNSGTGSNNTVIGQGSAETGGSGSDTVIGQGITVSQGAGQNVVIGATAQLSGLSTAGSVAVGYSVSVTADKCTIMGAAAFSSNSACIVIGNNATSTAGNQLIIGSTTAPVTVGVLGAGVVDPSPPAPAVFTLQTTSGTGSNKTGYDFRIAAGQSTGNANGGQIVLKTATPGSSGSGVNGLSDRLTIDTKGNIVPGSAALSTTATDGFQYIETCAGAPTGAPTAFTGRYALVYDSTNNNLYVYNAGSSTWKKVTLT